MIKSFFAALSFISRLPVPARLSQGLEIEQYQRSIVTFPLVGLLLGAIAGALPHFKGRHFLMHGAMEPWERISRADYVFENEERQKFLDAFFS